MMLSDSYASTDFDAAAQAIAFQREWQRHQVPCVEALFSCPDVFDDLLRSGVPVRLTKSSAAREPRFGLRAFELIAAPTSSREVRILDAHIHYGASLNASSEARSTFVTSTPSTISALAELEGMASLKSGWDGEGAEAPSPEALYKAQQLLLALSHLDGDWSSTIHADGRPIIERQTIEGYDEIVVSALGELIIWSERHGKGASRAITIDDARSHFEQLA